MGWNMWTEKFDLHSHSTNSDGQHSVDDVAQMMSDSKVRYWSLTDHDTISGWNAARNAAAAQGLVFIPGVELTCMPGLPADVEILELRNQERASDSWHLLAYFPKLESGSRQHLQFQAWLAPLGEGRIPRMLTMIEKLSELGMPVDFEAVIARAGDSVGRPHLADEMMALGYVETRQEAFDKWIGDSKPAHITRPQPSIAEACSAVHAAGGITSLAHPLYYCIETDALVTFCLESGVDAIECFHRSHSDAYRFQLWSAAKESGLSVTCGSDFHGMKYNQMPGRMAVPTATLPPLLRDSMQSLGESMHQS